jgi:hypothetical protein
MREGVVDQHHWLTNDQCLDAVAMGLITPGPVVISAGFIGYLVAGLPGAIVSGVAIFTPIYLGVVVPGRGFLRHRATRSSAPSSRERPQPPRVPSAVPSSYSPGRRSRTSPPRRSQ